jgi:iron complex outermembrane receptor protein
LPSFIELFGQGGIQKGNPNLKPEEGEGWDVGAIVSWPFDAAGGARFRSWLEVVYFETRTREAIIWLQNSQRTTLAMNLERTRAEGTETLLRTRFRQRGPSPRWLDPALALDVAFTRIDARDDGPSRTYHGKVLPHQPRDRLSVETRLDLGKVRLAHLADHESALFRDRYNSEQKRRGPRVIHDLEASLEIFRDRLDATFGVRNVADRQTQDIDGFPVPGRSVFVQLTVSGSADKTQTVPRVTDES